MISKDERYLLGKTESGDDYKKIIDESPAMWRKINSIGIILDCNDSYAEKLGYPKKEIIGKSIFEHVAQESWDKMKESFDRWGEKGEVSDMQLVFKRSDGSTFPVLLNATSIFDEYGNLSGSNTVIVDLSGVK